MDYRIQSILMESREKFLLCLPIERIHPVAARTGLRRIHDPHPGKTRRHKRFRAIVSAQSKTQFIHSRLRIRWNKRHHQMESSYC